jgi:trypsin
LSLGAFRVAVCGVCVALAAAASTVTANGLIGGHPISIRSAPWAVIVNGKVPHEKEYLCTGSIIDSLHVITAAHCLFNDHGVFAGREMTVEAGVSNEAHPGLTGAEQKRTVRSVRADPMYAWRIPDFGYQHDLAILTLSSPLDLTGPDVRAVALPSASAPIPARAAVLAGFGDPKAGTPGGLLEQARVRINPHAHECRADGGLCASSATSAFCEGDSGAGLIVSGETPTLLAVATSSTGICEPGVAGLYAYLATPSTLRFIHGRTRLGAPPLAPASRWAPYGWVSFEFGSAVLSVPRAWTPPQATLPAWNPTTGAQANVGTLSSAGTRSTFFALALKAAEKRYRALDPHALMHTRAISLPSGPALEITTKLTDQTSSSKTRLSFEDYLLIHGTAGYDVEYVSPRSADIVNLPVFERSAQTIHFLKSG